MMDETKSGMSVLSVLFIILVIWAIFGNGFNGNGGLFGGRNTCVIPAETTGCNRVSNCEVEKSGIINSASTQFLIEQNGAATRTAIRDSQDVITAQNNRIYEQRLQETIFDLKIGNQAKDAKIAQLETQIHNDAKFGALEKQISDCCCGMNQRFASIECNMLTKPNLYGVAATCSGQTIPNGFNTNCNNGCCNRNI